MKNPSNLLNADPEKAIDLDSHLETKINPRKEIETNSQIEFDLSKAENVENI